MDSNIIIQIPSSPKHPPDPHLKHGHIIDYMSFAVTYRAIVHKHPAFPHDLALEHRIVLSELETRLSAQQINFRDRERISMSEIPPCPTQCILCSRSVKLTGSLPIVTSSPSFRSTRYSSPSSAPYRYPEMWQA